MILTSKRITTTATYNTESKYHQNWPKQKGLINLSKANTIEKCFALECSPLKKEQLLQLHFLGPSKGGRLYLSWYADTDILDTVQFNLILKDG